MRVFKIMYGLWNRIYIEECEALTSYEAVINFAMECPEAVIFTVEEM